MAIITKTPQPQVPAQPTKSAKEIELENQVKIYDAELLKMADKVYLANLKDDVFFRVELLTALNNIAGVFQNFLNEIKQSQQGGEQQ